jgi:hypothetical protein
MYMVLRETNRLCVTDVLVTNVIYFKQGNLRGMKQGMSEDQDPLKVGRPSMPVRGAALNEEEEMDISGV